MFRSVLGIADAEAPSDGYVPAFSAQLGRHMWKPITGALLSGFAAGLVAFGSATGGLTTDATLSYSGGVLSASNLKSTSLTSTRIVFSTTGGQLTDSANLTYASGGALQITTADATVGFRAAGSTGRVRVRGYVDATNGCVFESTDTAESTYKPLSFGASAYRFFSGAVATFLDSTASTSTSTGAVVIGNGSSGGLGVGGAINAGGTIRSTANSPTGDFLGAGASAALRLTANATGTDAGLQFFGSTHATLANQAFIEADTVTVRTANFGTTYGTITSTGWTIAQSTASSSATTGALVVTGGAGIGGAVNIGGGSLTMTSSGVQTLTLFDTNTAASSWALQHKANGDLLLFQPSQNNWVTFTHATGKITSIGQLAVTDGTDSSSNTTGAIVSGGGLGVGKRISAGGAILSSGATNGIGYATGAGGTVTQATSKSTGVTLNNVCGQITMNAAALAAGAKVTFTLTSSAIAATDEVGVCVASGGTANAYRAAVTAVAAGSCAITVENITAGSLSEAPVLTFAVHKAVTA